MAAPATLAEALVAFQGDPPHIPFDSVNPHFKNRYASLAGIMSVVLPALTKQGLAIIQQPCGKVAVADDDTEAQVFPMLRTTLIHTSGEQISDVMPLAIERPGPQAQGSALTYARRYAVLAVLGLVADEDDDANAAEKPKASKPAAAGGADSSEEGLTASLLAAAEQLAVREEKPEMAVQVADAVEASKRDRSPEDHLAWLAQKVASAKEVLEGAK